MTNKETRRLVGELTETVASMSRSNDVILPQISRFSMAIDRLRDRVADAERRLNSIAVRLQELGDTQGKLVATAERHDRALAERKKSGMPAGDKHQVTIAWAENGSVEAGDMVLGWYVDGEFGVGHWKFGVYLGEGKRRPFRVDTGNPEEFDYIAKVTDTMRRYIIDKPELGIREIIRRKLW